MFYFLAVTKVINTYLYYKNGSHLDINHYRIEFPVGHWAYFGESKITYVVTGNRIDGHNLSAEFFKDTETSEITDTFKNILHNCNKVETNNFLSGDLEGIIHICYKENSEIFYFISNDKEIVIRENDYNATNIKIVEEYELLLNSIKRNSKENIKKTPKINLKEFLPLDSNATKYTYEIIVANDVPKNGKINSKIFYKEIDITSRNNDCISISEYMIFDKQDVAQMPDGLKEEIKDNRLANGSTKICANNERISYEDGTILYQQDEDWTMEVEFDLSSGEEETTQAKCRFVSLSSKVIFDKKRRVIHSQCQYEVDHGMKEKIDWFLLEGLGLYKTIMTTGEEKTNCHGTITTTLSHYE